MYDLVLLIIGIPILGYAAQRQKENGIKRNEDKLVYIACLFAAALWIILFSGLRTRYNDAIGYARGYAFLSNDFSFDLSKLFAEKHYGFGIYQHILKAIFPYTQWIFMGTSIIVNVVYLKYLLRHSQTICMTLYCYLVIGTWTFSMAGLKQILAMTVSMIAIEFLLRKKYIWFYVFLFVAYTFHPYIFVLAILPFLTDSVWSKKMVLITVAVALICVFFEPFFSFFLDEFMQNEYTMENLIVSRGINPLRVLVDAFPILLLIHYRRKINEEGSTAVKLGANMMIVSWLFTFMSLFGSPIYLYRVGRYFASYIPIVVPWILKFCLPETKWKKLLIAGSLLFYGILFIYLETNGFNFSRDVFRHTGIKSLFSETWKWGF